MKKSQHKTKPSSHALSAQGSHRQALGLIEPTLRSGSPTGGKRARRDADTTLILTIGILVIIVTFLLFGRTLTYPFINFDDPAYILERPEITRGITLSGIGWSLTHVHGGNWHPLTSISHMIDYHWFDGHAGAHHLVNVLLHTLAASMLFLVLRSMTGALWRSAFVAVLFAIHPLRVESVAWIAERKDVLSGFFFMLTLGAYARYVRAPSVWRYSLILISLLLGLMAKPMLVTLPFLLLLLDYWPLRRFEGTKRDSPYVLVLEKLPLLMLAAGSAIATMLAQRDALSTVEHVPLGWRISNALVSYFSYIGKMFWPSNLALFYPFPQSPFPSWQVLLALVLLLLVSGLAIFWRNTRPYFFTGWFWYLGMLVPVIGIIQVGMQSRADRYTYLPEIGLAVAVVWGVAELTARWRHQKLILATSATVISVVLGTCTWWQLGYWRDSETLWNHAIAVTSNNDAAHAYLADLLLRENRVEESLSQAEEALRIQPDNRDAQNNLSLALFREGRLGEAVEHWKRSLELKPDSLNAQCNLAWVLATSPDPALRDGVRATQLTESVLSHAGRDNPSVLRTAGAAYAETGQFDKAIALAEEALKITRAQGNKPLTEDLQHNIENYRKQLPLRDPGVTVR
jgi:protein O-mannosyl-transferase